MEKEIVKNQLYQYTYPQLAVKKAATGLGSIFNQQGGSEFNQRQHSVVNNGAAGMPNFKGDLAGLCTRVSTVPSPHPVLHETRVAGAYVALVPVRFDTDRWRAEFLAQWPAGSAAWLSYFHRITAGPAFTPPKRWLPCDHCGQRAASAIPTSNGEHDEP